MNFYPEFKNGLIRFYDADHAGKPGFNRVGQFVTEYKYSTLWEDRANLRRYGMSLYGGVSKWVLSPADMQHILNLICLHETGNLFKVKKPFTDEMHELYIIIEDRDPRILVREIHVSRNLLAKPLKVYRKEDIENA